MDSAAPVDRDSNNGTRNDRTQSHPGPGALGATDLTPGDRDPADSGAAATAEVVAAASRSERSPKDMAISLLVLLIPIALLVGFYRVFLGGDQPTEIDPAPTVAQARSINAFPVSEPVGLADGWQSVTANLQRPEGAVTLRLGYLSPNGGAVQVVQSNLPAERLLPAELTPKGQPQGATEVDGRSWQRYTARASERALVLMEPGRTVIVVGSARESELRDLAGALG
ncbi:DUF4245 domain-containing protein [Micromonospora sp. NPDC050417]|uniref:DUF4245 domain-containing protein n=1 Tax=Micromonospora sp. NPDC050417 TaxID=3364280 RepID=UPI0037BDE51F